MSFAIFGKEPIVSKTVCISGKIEHFKLKYLYIGFVKNYLLNEKLIAADTVTSKTGEFYMKFRWEYPWPVYLVMEDVTVNLFLSPGDSIYLTANHNKFFSSFKFSGRGGTENQYLNNFLLSYDNVNNEFHKTFIELSEKEFLRQNDARYDEQIKYFEKNDTAENNKYFKGYASSLIDYEYFNNILLFGKMKGKYIDDDYTSEMIDSTKISNDMAISSLAYQRFIENYADYYVYKTKRDREDPIGNIWDFKFKVIKHKFSGRARDILLARILISSFQYTTSTIAMNLFNEYKNICFTREYINYIQKNFVFK